MADMLNLLARITTNFWPFYSLPQLQTSLVFRHACQTPLTTLITATEFASRSEHRQSEQKTYLNLAKNAARRLGDLFAALDQPRRSRSFKVIESVYEAAALISPHRADLRIIIDKKLQQLSPNLTGNKLYFTESLICLLNNAHEATPHLHVVPLIMLVVHMRGKSHIQLDIIDSGSGMGMLFPTQIIWRQSSTKHHCQGVGLWFAHQTLTQMFRGQVITSSSSHGTRVSISLPLHKKHSHKTGVFSHNQHISLNANEFVSRIRQVKPLWAGTSPPPIPQR